MIGTEWIVEAAGCNATALTRVDTLAAIFSAAIRELDLHPLHEPAWHVFPSPGGITGFVMLTESHLACHTYPEFGIATFNLYCCRPRLEWPWEERLTAALGASLVRVRRLDRSIAVEESVATGMLAEERS